MIAVENRESELSSIGRTVFSIMLYNMNVKSFKSEYDTLQFKLLLKPLCGNCNCILDPFWPCALSSSSWVLATGASSYDI